MARKNSPNPDPKADQTGAASALGAKGVVDESRFEALSGLESLPFPRPARLKSNERWQVAVKVIDPRGNEGLRVIAMPEEPTR